MKRKFFMFFLIFMFLLANPVNAMTFRSSEERLLIPKGEVIQGDLYASGGTVDIEGGVNGDLLVAGGYVVVNGDVSGDLISAGGVVTINGDVKEDVLLFGGNINVNGKIGGDFKAGGGSVVLSEKGKVGEDALIGCGNFILNGSIGESLLVRAGSVILNGSVGDDARISSENLTLGSNAQINGNLTYYSSNKVKVTPGAQVAGEIVQKVPPRRKPKPSLPFAGAIFYLLFSLASFLASLFTAFILLALFPKVTRETSKTLRGGLWKSLGIGFLVLILLPPLAIFSIFTFIGLPLGMIGFAFYFVFLYLSQIIFSIFLGEKVLSGVTKEEETSPYLSAFMGLLIIAILGFIPFLGWLVKFVVVLFGLGALALVTFEAGKKSKETLFSELKSVESVSE
jgi:cytoskeletal protein CcmA (bactofilin family)